MPKRRNPKHLQSFPFGEHKGKPIDEVPAKYLLDLYSEDWIGKWPTIKEWIEKNLDGLEEEVIGDEVQLGEVDTGEAISFEDYLKERRPYL